MNRILAWTHAVAAVLLIGLLMAGCGGGNDPAPVPMIGSAGGTVAGPAGAQVVVPAGALPQPTAVAVAQSSAGAPALPAGLAAAGPVFAFTPHGTAFALPATVTLPFDANQVPAGATPVLYKTDAAGQWNAVPGASLNAGTATAMVDSFSWFVVGLLPPQITQQPASVAVVEPAVANFSVTALGAPPFSYQWQRSGDGGVTWADLPGATASNYSTGSTSIATDDGARFRVMVSNADGTTISSAAVLTVSAVVVAPTITSQPSDVTVAEGAAASFSCVAGSTGVAYQWQRSNDGGSTWADVGGQTNASLQIAVAAAGDSGSRWRCRASNSAGTVFSDAALLTVTSAPPPPTMTPSRLAAGIDFSVVRMASAAAAEALRSWGSDAAGYLGTGPGDQSRNVVGGGVLTSNIVSVHAGSAHALAVRGTGEVVGWGYNGFGQLSVGNNLSREAPTGVVWNDAGTTRSYSDAVAACGGDLHSLVLRSSGLVNAMGFNMNGELGDGSTTDRLIGVPVSGLAGATAVACGGGHSLALLADGTVRAWGRNNAGQLGDGSTTNRSLPTIVSGLTGVVAIAAGTQHSLALRNDGSVWAWGDNTNGKLGVGNAVNSPVPVATMLTSGVAAIAAGYQNSMALMVDGSVRVVGINEVGELGTGSLTPGFVSAWVTPAISSVVAISVSSGSDLSHLMAQRADGSLLVWGNNANGQLGLGPGIPFTATPTAAPGLNLN